LIIDVNKLLKDGINESFPKFESKVINRRIGIDKIEKPKSKTSYENFKAN